MLQLIDTISRKRGNPYMILLVYPFVVPIFAAFFFYVEHHASNAQVHNYVQALILMMSYSLTVGLAASHPVTYIGKCLAGVMFLTGLMCVSIIGNALSERYAKQAIIRPSD
jgi:cytochrome c biogenesis factor